MRHYLTVGFDITASTVIFSTALEFAGSGLPIGDISFKSMRVIFSARLGDDLEFTASGEVSMSFDIYPPLSIFNSMFGWLKPGCDPATDVLGSTACDIFGSSSLEPMQLVGSANFDVGFSATNGVYFAMGGFLKLTGAKDVVWANPFGLAPSMGLLFPYSFNFLEKVSACIAEVSAASAEIAATSGVAAIWRVFTVAYMCLPANPEFEAGFMMCSSALYIDGQLPVDLGFGDASASASVSASSSASSLSTVGGAAALGAAENQRQSKLLGASDALAIAPDPEVAQLGAADKRFDKTILSRYTCAGYDIFGPKPVYGFVSLAFKIVLSAKFKLAFTFGLNNMLMTRLFLALAQFNPVSFLANYALSSGENLPWVKSAMDTLKFDDIQTAVGDFVKVFDIMQMERVECSINLSPFPSKLLSGTVIPTGIYFMMKNVEILYMFKFELLLLNMDIFTLEPKIDLHMFIPKSRLLLGKFVLQLAGADPCIAKALGRIIAKKEAEAARLMELERLSNEKALAAEMAEMKKAGAYTRPQGQRRKPGASSYTLTRLSPYTLPLISST